MNGVVTRVSPERGISFHQETSDRALSLDIDYTLIPTREGTIIHRTGAILTSAYLYPLGTLVAWFIRRENIRTTRRLLTHLDSLSTPTEDPHD